MNVRVYNDNVHPYYEKFKGEDVSIPARGFVEMDFFEAVEFRGTYSPIQVDGGGAAKPESFKMLRIVQPQEFVVEDKKEPQCHSCGKFFENLEILDAHISELHIDQILDKDEKEKRLKTKGK